MGNVTKAACAKHLEKPSGEGEGAVPPRKCTNRSKTQRPEPSPGNRGVRRREGEAGERGRPRARQVSRG